MKLSFKYSLMTILMALALMISAIGVTPVFADGETPPPDPIQLAAEEPVVAEVLDQLPGDTSLVVVDAGGEALSLASQEAADALTAPDPYFWVGGTYYSFTAADCDPDTDGDQPCDTPIQAAIDYLADLDATPYDNAIYVEAGDYNEDITIDGSRWSDLGDLWLIGAGSDSTTLHGYLDVYNLNNSFSVQGFTFTDWVYLQSYGDVSAYDVVIDGTNSDGGLYVYSGGDVTLEDVTSTNSSYDGAEVYADGSVSVQESAFEDNEASGLYISAYGDAVLNGVTANRNTYDGGSVWAGGDLTILNSSFYNNDWYGLRAGSDSGTAKLDGVTANGNNNGADVSGYDVNISNSTFSNNTFRGVYVQAEDTATLNRVTVDGNDRTGAFLFSSTLADVYCSSFTSNGTGITAMTPNLYLHGVSFADNGTDYEMYAKRGPAGNVWVKEYNCKPVPPPAANAPVSQSPVEEKGYSPLYVVLPQTQDQLPGALGSGDTFGSAFKVEFNGQGMSGSLHTLTLSFPIPASMKGANLAVMFWNGTAWVEVSGGSAVGNTFVITVSQPGLYVLVSK